VFKRIIIRETFFDDDTWASIKEVPDDFVACCHLFSP